MDRRKQTFDWDLPGRLFIIWSKRTHLKKEKKKFKLISGNNIYNNNNT